MNWQDLFENMAEGVVVGEAIRDAAGVVIDWRYVDVNASWERLVSKSRADVVGQSVRSVHPRAVADVWVDDAARVVGSGRPVPFSRGATGGTWFEGHAFRLADDRFALIFVDVATQRCADVRREALLELADRERDVTDPDAIARISSELIVRTLGVARAGYGSVDADAETITVQDGWFVPGSTPFPTILRCRDYGSFIDDLKAGREVQVDDVATDARTMERRHALEALGIRSMIDLPIVENGRCVAVLFVEHGAPRVWSHDDIAFVREVADRTRAAVERRISEAKLRSLAASLESQVRARTDELLRTEQRLRQSSKMEAIGQLTGGVAHDFNNFLTVIRSSADLLRRDRVSDERRRRYVDAISDTADRAAKLTGQLLAFSRRQALRAEVFDAVAQVHGIAEILRSVLTSRIALEIVDPGFACPIETDSLQFESAIVNLVANARDATTGRGTVTIRIAPTERASGDAAPVSMVGVAVTDTGSGIASEHIARLFEPFFTTKPLGKGTGLGLSQVFGFARQSGGDLEVANAPPRGATFTLLLPHVAAPVERPATDTDAHQAPVGTARILVVDDNVDVGSFATDLLQDLGYETALVPNAADAIRLLETDWMRFDVVFSDVVMDGMDGLELGRHVRRCWPRLAVVLTSGFSEVLAADARHGFDLLHKPYSIDQLSSMIRRAIATH